MIQLDSNEKKWILACKGHFKTKYPYTGYWHNTLKPLWTEIYGWDPDHDNNYHDYLRGLFNKLLSVFLKIKDKWSSENAQLEELFWDVFYKTMSNDADLPIERGIHKLCSLIYGTTFINKDGTKRFDLSMTDEKPRLIKNIKLAFKKLTGLSALHWIACFMLASAFLSCGTIYRNKLIDDAAATYSISTEYFKMAVINKDNQVKFDSLLVLGYRYRYIADSLYIELIKAQKQRKQRYFWIR